MSDATAAEPTYQERMRALLSVPCPMPRVGQIWADNDPRSAGRTVRIVALVRRHLPFTGRHEPAGVPHAVVETLTDASNATTSRVGRRTTIRLDRLKPTRTGYRLVQDVPR